MQYKFLSITIIPLPDGPFYKRKLKLYCTVSWINGIKILTSNPEFLLIDVFFIFRRYKTCKSCSIIIDVIVLLIVDNAGMFQLVDRRAEPVDGHGLSEKHCGQMPRCWHRSRINFGQTASGNDTDNNVGFLLYCI